MKLLRNKEVRKSLIISLIFSGGVTGIAFVFGWIYGIFTGCVCIGFLLIQFFTLRSRYRKIGNLANDIDRILHGNGSVSLDCYAEGELGILQSEISKMTVRLREQKDRLQEDKVYLADSIADISHQIRTPLTSINLLVEMLSQPDIDGERRIRLTRDLYELLGRIEWLITALLKISKLDAGTVQFKPERVRTADLIDRAASPLLIPMELRRQAVEISAEGMFFGDISWTCEALGNIIKNCMEHTPEGGKISISSVETGIFTEITIRDSGPGIDPEDLPRIFERFYKGKNSDENSFGIGLALARMIAVRQNGTLKAENPAGGGAKFTLRFYKGTV